MPTLHLVNKTAALGACLGVAADDDTILLLEDGVYAAAMAVADGMHLSPGRCLHALQADVIARGLSERLAAQTELVTDDAFVALVVAHQPVVTWRS